MVTAQGGNGGGDESEEKDLRGNGGRTGERTTFSREIFGMRGANVLKKSESALYILTRKRSLYLKENALSIF